jgi:hypothetical protein
LLELPPLRLDARPLERDPLLRLLELLLLDLLEPLRPLDLPELLLLPEPDRLRLLELLFEDLLELPLRPRR